MPFIEIKDGHLFYCPCGSHGRWLIFIHGAWASHRWWKSQTPAFSPHYQILTFDLRGHGQSCPLSKNFSFLDFVNDLNLLIAKMGMREVGLIGWSLGGMISLQYCLDHPQIVQALVLITTPAQRQQVWKRKFWLSYLRAKLNLMINLSAPRKFDRQGGTFPGEKERFEEEIKKMFSFPINQEIYAWLKGELQNYYFNNYWSTAKILDNWKIEAEELKKISAPTLILAGEKDQITPPSAAKFLHQAILHSRLILIKEAGHLLPLERPQEVNNCILKFLEEINY